MREENRQLLEKTDTLNGTFKEAVGFAESASLVQKSEASKQHGIAHYKSKKLEVEVVQRNIQSIVQVKQLSYEKILR